MTPTVRRVGMMYIPRTQREWGPPIVRAQLWGQMAALCSGQPPATGRWCIFRSESRQAPKPLQGWCLRVCPKAGKTDALAHGRQARGLFVQFRFQPFCSIQVSTNWIDWMRLVVGAWHVNNGVIKSGVPKWSQEVIRKVTYPRLTSTQGLDFAIPIKSMVELARLVFVPDVYLWDWASRFNQSSLNWPSHHVK